MIMFMAIAVPPVHAASADAMWVDPSTVTLTSSDIGTTFNVTVSMNFTESVYAWQVGLHYNRTLFACTAAGFTAGGTSQYFMGHTTTPAGPTIDTSDLGNGSVLAGETLLGSDLVAGPHEGSLVWVEFKVLNYSTFLPSSGNLTTTIDIMKEYPDNTYVLDVNLNTISMSGSNSTVTFVPEFTYLLLPIFLALTLMATILKRRRQRKLE
jgi:hypothetical protein